MKTIRILSKFVFHTQSFVLFIIQVVRHDTYDRFRYNFLYENNTPPPFVTGIVSHIKPQVYFFEIGMERPLYTPNLCFKKHKTYKAEVTFAVKKIKLCFRGQIGKQYSGINFVID